MPNRQQSQRDKALSIIADLNAGKPIEYEFSSNLLNLNVFSKLSNFINVNINKLLTNDAAKVHVNLWIKGTYGNGKTQTLKIIKHFINECVNTRSPDDRILLTYLGLDEKIEKGYASRHIQKDILLNSIMSVNCENYTYINSFISNIRSNYDKYAGSEVDNVIGFIFDIATNALNLLIPGGGGAAAIGWKKLFLLFGKSKWNITRILHNKMVFDPFVTELLVEMIKFGIDPSTRKFTKLSNKIDDLSNIDKLWNTYLNIAKFAKYKTIVFLVDNAEILSDSPEYVEAFKSIWDDQNMQAINTFFIFASTLDRDEFIDSSRYGGFSRRYAGYKYYKARQFKLVQPDISSNFNTNDDLNTAITSLLHLAQYLPETSLAKNSMDYISSSDFEDSIRNLIKNKINESDLNWGILWKILTEHMFPGIFMKSVI